MDNMAGKQSISSFSVTGKSPSWMGAVKKKAAVSSSGSRGQKELAWSDTRSEISSLTSGSAGSSNTSSLNAAVADPTVVHQTPRSSRSGGPSSGVWSDTSSLFSSSSLGNTTGESLSSKSRSSDDTLFSPSRFAKMFSPLASDGFYSPLTRSVESVKSVRTPTLYSRARESTQYGDHYTKGISGISSLATESVLVSVKQSGAMRDLCRLVLREIEGSVEDTSVYRDKSIGVLAINDRLVLTVSGSDHARERMQMKEVLSAVSDAISKSISGAQLIREAAIKRLSIRSKVDHDLDKYSFPSLSDVLETRNIPDVDQDAMSEGYVSPILEELGLGVEKTPSRILRSGVAQKASNQFLDFLLGQLHHEYEAAEGEQLLMLEEGIYHNHQAIMENIEHDTRIQDALVSIYPEYESDLDTSESYKALYEEKSLEDKLLPVLLNKTFCAENDLWELIVKEIVSMAKNFDEGSGLSSVEVGMTVIGFTTSADNSKYAATHIVDSSGDAITEKCACERCAMLQVGFESVMGAIQSGNITIEDLKALDDPSPGYAKVPKSQKARAFSRVESSSPDKNSAPRKSKRKNEEGERSLGFGSMNNLLDEYERDAGWQVVTSPPKPKLRGRVPNELLFQASSSSSKYQTNYWSALNGDDSEGYSGSSERSESPDAESSDERIRKFPRF